MMSMMKRVSIAWVPTRTPLISPTQTHSQIPTVVPPLEQLQTSRTQDHRLTMTTVLLRMRSRPWKNGWK